MIDMGDLLRTLAVVGCVLIGGGATVYFYLRAIQAGCPPRPVLPPIAAPAEDAATAAADRAAEPAAADAHPQ